MRCPLCNARVHRHDGPTVYNGRDNSSLGGMTVCDIHDCDEEP